VLYRRRRGDDAVAITTAEGDRTHRHYRHVPNGPTAVDRDLPTGLEDPHIGRQCDRPETVEHEPVLDGLDVRHATADFVTVLGSAATCAPFWYVTA